MILNALILSLLRSHNNKWNSKRRRFWSCFKCF